MPFAVNTPAGQVQLMDLPWEVLEQLESDTGRRWGQLLTAPGWDAKSVRLIYAACCAAKGVEPRQLTPRDMVGDSPVFVEVPDDLPTSYTDGIPDPKAEGGTVTPG